MNKTGGNLKPEVVKALGLEIGNTISVPVYVVDNVSLISLTPSYIYLYGEKEMGDWIETVLPETIVKVKVRLVFL